MSALSEHQTAQAAPDRIAGRTAVALGVVVSFWALILIDEIVVNITLARIGEALALSQTELSWVVNAYLLPFGGLLLLGGRAGDILGKRRVFLVGVALYTAACLLRAVAPELWVVIAARALQGTGAALATPCVLALIMGMFAEGPVRRRAIGVYTMVSGAGTAIGLLAVGLLGSVGSWRVVLLLAVPIGLVLLLLGPAVITETPRRPGRFDVAGALVSTLGLAAVVYALANSTGDGWRSAPVLVAFAVGSALLALFVLLARRSAQPILDLSLFADRDRVGSYLVLLLVQGTQIGQIFFLSQYFQLVLGWGPLTVAFSFLPVAGGIFATAGAVVRLVPRVGARAVVAVGAVLLLVSNLWLLRMDVGDGYTAAVLPSLLLVGAGLACTTIPATILATAGVDDDGSGAASSVVSTVQTVGSSLSLAIIVAVATTAAANAAASAPADVPAEAHAFGEGMWATFAAGGAFAVATLLGALVLRARRA